ncbi:hypothetical protein [Paenibacillus radicis (ex Gao et al. 2016)]|uniref:Uncharacterized protein n=1 Tax=Paenibacillus radicis (ex Gao et al. 2016) TaxID=1737354 RepID=A0A917HVI8_9BACL|nr:hypothetical protein [Paenibacillus radicis (ex Gao et al. 2016)]GGG89796.1 hypothetical protein GCM10010918_55760 [Paenibacillus radicis (ex Gao et al. 2016)]
MNLRKVRTGSAFAPLMLYKLKGVKGEIENKGQSSRHGAAQCRPTLPFLIPYNRCCDDGANLRKVRTGSAFAPLMLHDKP